MTMVIFLLLSLSGVVSGDFECLCNYHVESPIYHQRSEKSTVLGYVYEFDCKELVLGEAESDTWYTIAFSHQIGYMKKDTLVEVQICAGTPSTSDKVLMPSQLPGAHTESNLTSTVTTSTTEQQQSMSTSTQETSITSSTSLETTITTTETTTPSTTAEMTSHSTTTKMTIHPTTTDMTTPSTTTNVTTSSTSTETTAPSTTTIKTTSSSTTIEPTTFTTKIPKLTTATTSVPTTTQPPTSLPTTDAKRRCPRNLLETAKAEDGIVLVDMAERKCYEIIELHTSWDRAVSHCRQNGGRLATIKTSAQNELLHKYILSFDQHKTWIGLTDYRTDGQFRWDSGESVSYTNWKDNLVKRHEHCIVMDPVSGMWEDANCIWSYPYICEFNILPSSGSVVVG